MDYADLAGKLIISLIIGAVIGLERESQVHNSKSSKKPAAPLVGVRTFSLLTTLGAISGLMFRDFFPIFILISVTFVVILITYYVLHSFFNRDSGFTTELGILYSFLIGLFIALEIFPIQFTLALSVILVIILSRKSDIQIFLKGMHREEFNAFISYALIAIAILPFLPNKEYSLSNISVIGNFFDSLNPNFERISKTGIVNPFKLWFIVVAITGIDLLGYLFERTIGTKRGRFVASIVGGFISSTATTIAIAQESRKIKKSVDYLVASAVFANVASFFPLLILISLINSNFLIKASPILFLLIISGAICGIYFLKKGAGDNIKPKNNKIEGIKESEIFSLVPALKFALLFLCVTLLTRVGLEVFGQAGFLISSSIAALTGVDAVTINIANLAGKSIDAKTGAFALILMNAVNLSGKTIFSFIQGKKEFAVKFGISAGAMIVASLTALLFV